MQEFGHRETTCSKPVFNAQKEKECGWNNSGEDLIMIRSHNPEIKMP